MTFCAEFIIRWTSLLLCGSLCLLSARFIVSCPTVLQILVLLSEYECTSVNSLYYKTHIDVPVTICFSVKQHYNTALILSEKV